MKSGEGSAGPEVAPRGGAATPADTGVPGGGADEGDEGRAPGIGEAARFFVELGRPERPLYILGFLLILLANLGEIVWVRLTARAVEAAVGSRPVTGLALGLIGISILVFALKWSNRMAIFLAARRIERSLRSRAFGATASFSQEEMDEHRTGDLVSRIINDVSDIRMVLGSGFLQLSNNFFAYATTLLAMLYLVPQLAAAALLPFVPLVFVAQRLNAVNHARSRRSQEALGTLSASVEETVGGVEVLKSYDALRWQERRFATVNDRHYAAEVNRSLPEAVFIGLMGSAIWVGIAFLMVAAGAIISYDRLHHELPIADIATFIFLFAKLVWPTIALGWIMNVIQRGLAAARRLEPLLGEEPRENRRIMAGREEDGGEHAAGKAAGASIVVESLSYRYPTRATNAIEGVDLRIPSGEWVGIVGPTASGKTTLARLLAGLRTPTTGRVRIGDVDAYRISGATRPRTVHLATQSPTLFSRTIAENLRLAAARPVEDEELRAAVADAAFASDLAEMPEGLATPIGERGLLLSGGQRQRLSLARAWLGDPGILILDDILSAVDLHTELMLIEGIRRRRSGKTTIFITHRLRILTRLDRVIVLEHGHVLADGSLAEALERSSWLRDAWEAERLRAIIEGEGEDAA